MVERRLVTEKIMNSQDLTLSSPARSKLLKRLSPFWRDRLIEAGLILSIAFYYIAGNQHFGTNQFFHLNPFFSLPALLIFVILCWYRLSFAVALLPLTLPYYLLQKTVVGPYAFSLTEITLAVCLAVALLQGVGGGREGGLRDRFAQGSYAPLRGKWQYWLSWQELRDRLGPFAIPILVFFVAALLSVAIAYDYHLALRAFRKEVLDPLLYLLLALFCLRSWQDLARLLAALVATGLVVAFLGIIQYFFFRNFLVLEAGNIQRVHAVYGSANDIGLLFDYLLPLGLAMVMAKIPKAVGILPSWGMRILALVVCLPLLFVLYLTQSQGAWLAIAAAALFIGILSIRNRKVLIISTLVCVVVLVLAFVVFRTRITNFLLEGHVNAQNVSTATRRLYLWQTALRMIHDSPWLGYGMDNWLCHYSNNPICHTQLFHYILQRDPVTGASTHLQDEPLLSHPHNIFLHVWVSIGLFGLLAFIALLGLFFWLFARILTHLRATEMKSKAEVSSSFYHSSLQWMTIGVGASMLAALVQGQVDSSFLEQDLAFCFWILVIALLLLRVLSGTPWRRSVQQGQVTVSLPEDTKGVGP